MFGSFGAIIAEALALDEENARRMAEPVACPRCGTPLQVNSASVYNCPLGHWRSANGLV